MDRLQAVFAFAVIAVCLIAIVVLISVGAVPADVGLPVITLAVGAAIGYLFPSPLRS